MRAREADPADAVDRAHGPQQLGEQRAAAGQVAPVGVDVLAEQRDLGDAPAGQARDLGHDVVEGSAHLGPAHRGTMQKAHELSQPIWIVTQAA